MHNYIKNQIFGVILFAYVGFAYSALGRADESYQIVTLFRLLNARFDFVAAVHIVETALEEYAAGVVQFAYAFFGEVSAAQPHAVQSGITHGIVVHGDIGRNVLPYEGTALNHDVRSYVRPLMHCGMTSYDSPVAHLDFARERYAVGENAVIAHHVVVRYVDVSHQQVVVADDGLAARCRSAAYGHVFAYFVVVAYLGNGLFAFEFEVLGRAGYGGCRMYLAAFAYARSVVNHRTRSYPAVVAYDYVAGDVCKGFYRYVVTDFGIGMYVC